MTGTLYLSPLSLLTKTDRRGKIYLAYEILVYKIKLDKEESVENFNIGMDVVKILRQIMDGIKQNVEQEFKEIQITGPQGMLIRILIHNGEMKISDLSDKMGLSNSTVSGIVDRLEKQGFVERIRSVEDRRVVYVNLTSDFRKLAENHFNQVGSIVDDLLSGATAKDVEKIFEGLNLLKKFIDKQGVNK